MRRNLALMAGLAVTTACAGNMGTRTHDPNVFGARILSPSAGHVGFALTQPAYVALFEVVPGAGVSLLYPASYSDARRLHAPGVSTALFSPLQRGLTASYARTSFSGPSYLFLLASTSPLNVHSFIGSSTGLRAALGHTMFGSHNEMTMFSAIESLALVNRQPGTWTSDVYTIWPSARQSAPALAQGRPVRCDDGRVVLVRAGIVPPGCLSTGDHVAEQPPADTVKAPPRSPRRPHADGEREPRRPHADRPRGGRTHAGRPERPRERPQAERPRAAQPRVERPRVESPRAAQPRVERSQPARPAERPTDRRQADQ